MEIIISDEQQQTLQILSDSGYLMPIDSNIKIIPQAIVQSIVDEFIRKHQLEIEKQKLLAGPSDIEKAFQAERDQLKLLAITYIYNNPNCTQEELVAYLSPSETFVKVSSFIVLYIQGSFERGLILKNTFEAFRTFVLSRTPEELMKI